MVQIDIGQGKVLRLSDEFRVDIDRSVGELRMAFGHDAVLLCSVDARAHRRRPPGPHLSEVGRIRMAEWMRRTETGSSKRGHGDRSIVTNDAVALTDADLDEMASMGGAFDIGAVSKAKEDWVLATAARIEGKLHGFSSRRSSASAARRAC